MGRIAVAVFEAKLHRKRPLVQRTRRMPAKSAWTYLCKLCEKSGSKTDDDRGNQVNGDDFP